MKDKLYRKNRNLCKLTFIIVGFFILSSCARYKYGNEYFLEDPPEETIFSEEEYELYCRKEEALNHWLYTVVPRHWTQIKWYDLGHWCTWALFGNDDDGLFGEEATANFKCKEPVSGKKACQWYVRNPSHNFCFYVIGSAYCSNSEFTLLKMSNEECCMFQYDPVAKTTFPSEYTSFYLGFHGWKPFISLRLRYSSSHRSDFYAGWRCRGNFGLKGVILTKKKLKNVTKEHVSEVDFSDSQHESVDQIFQQTY